MSYERRLLLQLAFRIAGGAALIYLAYPETGPWTTVVLAIMLIGVEGNAYINSRTINVLAVAVKNQRRDEGPRE